ncbi:MAG: nucleotidyltransferase domain-containing protein [Pleurocapsa sp. SU_5_0]|nr:nucleotidyltransferase domain-containing protein [Pleurocapsa sp. SU_5_0]NJO98064.1 nucleotidyltransferase domain-containing protein [Pleurocapsa sp. CRU_1_2]NJR45512.1 nucleotidyltransferase domain-containing protein [Hyellaceae cyanobacterium CSU_1_1]
MNGQFKTYFLDEAITRRKQILEQERQTTLEQVKQWLTDNGHKYGIEQAYLFGSLISPHHFTQQSDVDVAVESIAAEDLFMAMTALAEAVGRDVDLIELPKCPFAHRIRQEGVLWTKTL